MFGKRASTLFREVASCMAETIPPYNGDQVHLIFQEINTHKRAIEDLYRAAHARERTRLQEAGQVMEEGQIEWERYREEAAACIVHNTCILRNKRLLLAYHSTRMDHVKFLRWQNRSLPEAVKQNLSPAEQQLFKDYDKILINSMRKGKDRVGLDLTLDLLPPRNPDVQVKVLKDYGEIMFSIGSVFLKAGAVHLLPRHEAEHLIREGVVQNLDLEQ